MNVDDLTRIRIAENQSTFRDANENIDQSAAHVGVDGEIPFLCECPEPTCTQIVRLDREVYAQIRSHPRLFFSAPGHEEASLQVGAGRVVEHRESYLIVEKTGVAGQVAEREA